MDHSAKASLTHLKSIQTIERLEQQYSTALSKINSSFEATFEAYFELTAVQRSLKKFILGLNTRPSFPRSETIQKLLKDYLLEFDSIHDTTLFWVTAYLGLIWPDEILSKKIRRRTNAKTKTEWQQRAQRNLGSLANTSTPLPGRNDQHMRILELLSNSQTLDRNSLAWLKNHRHCVASVYDEMLLTVNENRQRINSCFRKTAYGLNIPQYDEYRRSLINDWLNGYKQPGPDETAAESRADETITKGLRFCEQHRALKLALRNFGIAMTVLALYACAHFYKIEINVYTYLKSQTLRLLSLDPASLNLKQKKDYFYKYILEINEQVKPDELLRSVQNFKEQRLYEQPSGVYVFAEDILKDYFLLLSAQKMPPEIRSGVLEIAGLIDGNIQSIIKQITEMFDDKIIEDSKLRDLLLQLRRAFVRHSIFPFTFIVIKNDAPYLFMFPEKILKRFRFTTQQFEYVGFNSSYYSQHARFPLKVFVVKGDRYPFKDRSGYFEGEFAIVFADISINVEWSALHEFAHIIDHMRYMYGGRMLPSNIEINAMLFPAMFSSDPKGYFAQRLFPIIENRDAGDSYVQASKGILNGFLLFKAQKAGVPAVEITDEFLPKDIMAAQTLIASLCDDSIRGIALEMYKKPGIYLKTARSGEYRGIISNAEEIVAGTPRAPYGGFILGRGYSGPGDSASGIKFVFDNQNDDLGFFQGKNIFGIIHEIFRFMVQAHNSDSEGFTLMNIIAAVVDFFLIIGFFLGIHWWGTPLRKQKFYGPDFPRWFNSVYANNPISDGRSSGDQPGEKQLLSQVLKSKGVISEELHRKVKTLKSGMTPQQTAVLDTLLTLAPFNPQMSMIRSKWHDFMFWLPYFGPTLARSPWLFKRQRAFRQWETFNDNLLRLAKSINRTTSQEIWEQRYKQIIKEFKDPGSLVLDKAGDKNMLNLNEIQRRAVLHLHDINPATDLKTPARSRRLPWLSNHDGEFDHLAPYSWQDDVKRIDWKATARSANREAKVKRYSGSAGSQIEFLIDLRSMNQTQGQEKIARDLIHSLHILKHDNELKSITLVLPNGDVRQKNVTIKGSVNRMELTQRIWPVILKELEEHLLDHQALKATALVFYTAQENALYRRITELTDLAVLEGQTKEITHIPVKGLNIYLIGVEDKDRDDIARLLPRANQPFYWK